MITPRSAAHFSGERPEATSARDALRLAVGDLYQQSWRLFVLNAALAVTAAVAGFAAAYYRLAVVGLVLLGPLAAAVMHCAVTVVTTEDLRLGTAVAGLRLHWRRGLELGAVAAGVVLLGIGAVAFYARLHGFAVPLAFVTLYLLFLAGLFLLLLLARSVAEPQLPLREAVPRTAVLALTRPRAALGLGLTLLLVNAAGVAAALMPFLTLTVAYSFLAAARFAIPTEA
jgi:hypothetical protein